MIIRVVVVIFFALGSKPRNDRRIIRAYLLCAMRTRGSNFHFLRVLISRSFSEAQKKKKKKKKITAMNKIRFARAHAYNIAFVRIPRRVFP